ncbi:SWI/SNF complex component SNF12 [Sesamum angolense]|uniref:SWI/SNF complex component SNF12 n=1 Tax=Sesamum angolense TaxID=2727404 RepID=A0AAE1WGD2_9LAMI|nr:SWI/SNF complex component SNF12 [Sesamum angolense]
MPEWTFEGGFQYATAGAGLSLPQNGHAVLLGQDGRINQAFTATGQQMQYLLTFALARGVQKCTSNARLVVSIAHGCVYLSQFWELPVLPSDVCFINGDKESLCAGTHLLVSGKELDGLVVWRYELVKNKWYKGPSMRTPRCLFASTTCGSYAYVAGGMAVELNGSGNASVNYGFTQLCFLLVDVTMSANNNHPQKNIGASSPFGNSLPVNPSTQQQLGSGFPGQLQLSEAQMQALAQAQSKAEAQAQAHARARMFAAHAQIQAQWQAAQGLPFNQGHSGGIANLGSQSPSVSGAGSAGAKRFPQKPPVHPPSFSPSTTASPLRTMDASAAARRKKQKLPEKQLQERVAAILPESALYTQLLEFESRVDAALTRKKIDIQEALKTPTYIQKTLRIYVFNTFANQIRTIPKKPNAEPPTWTLRIVGRILEEGVDPDQAAMMQNPSSSYPKFSSFFKRVTITLDQKLYPDNHLIIWDSARSPAPHEGFEILKKDLKLVSGEASRNAEKERHSDFFNQPWVEDAVIRYLNRKLPGDAPGNT